jgi:RNA polymerase sigma-B factor
VLENAVTGWESESLVALGPSARPTIEHVRLDELFVRWQRGRDERARAELVEQFMPLARKLARRYGGREPFDDLLQVASIGLLKAIDRFDSDRGAAFSSYAVPTILGELKRHFRDTGWFVHVPRGAQELALKVQQAEERLSASSGRSPSVQELAQYLEIGVEDVIGALEAAAGHHSTPLDAPSGRDDDERATLADTLGAEDERFELIDAGVTIATVASELPERERLVLGLYFFEDQTQSQIADEIGVSQMQVSRILRRALKRLRELTAGDAGPQHGS